MACTMSENVKCTHELFRIRTEVDHEGMDLTWLECLVCGVRLYAVPETPEQIATLTHRPTNSGGAEMKTNEEILNRHYSSFSGMERWAVCNMLDECRRDTWSAATRAQMKSDEQNTSRGEGWEEVPFQEVK